MFDGRASRISDRMFFFAVRSEQLLLGQLWRTSNFSTRLVLWKEIGASCIWNDITATLQHQWNLTVFAVIVCWSTIKVSVHSSIVEAKLQIKLIIRITHNVINADILDHEQNPEMFVTKPQQIILKQKHTPAWRTNSPAAHLFYNVRDASVFARWCSLLGGSTSYKS